MHHNIIRHGYWSNDIPLSTRCKRSAAERLELDTFTACLPKRHDPVCVDDDICIKNYFLTVKADY